MTAAEVVLVAVFGAVWLAPLTMALVWERRNARLVALLRTRLPRDRDDRAP